MWCHAATRIGLWCRDDRVRAVTRGLHTENGDEEEGAVKNLPARGRLDRPLFVVLFLASLICLPGLAAAKNKPNIILVFMDNFGWGEPGFNGGGIIRGSATPRLDQLADV